MNTIKVKNWHNVPNDYTGVVVLECGDKIWFKNGNYHREDGPAMVLKSGNKEWWLDGKYIWNSYGKLILTNKIILSKTQHPKYPTVQVWKILDSIGLYDFIVIPKMEELITE